MIPAPREDTIVMMKPEDVQAMLTKQFPEGEVTVQDLTGSQDHFHVMVMWKGFAGKGLIEQHQLVNRALHDPLEDGRIHALQIKTYVP